MTICLGVKDNDEVKTTRLPVLLHQAGALYKDVIYNLVADYEKYLNIIGNCFI